MANELHLEAVLDVVAKELSVDATSAEWLKLFDSIRSFMLNGVAHSQEFIFYSKIVGVAKLKMDKLEIRLWVHKPDATAVQIDATNRVNALIYYELVCQGFENEFYTRRYGGDIYSDQGCAIFGPQQVV